MGGATGFVEGKTKLATWKAFERLGLRKKEEETGLYLDFPRNKKEAFRMMVPRDEGSGWVLKYHLHT